MSSSQGNSNTNYILTGLLVGTLIIATVRLSRCSTKEAFQDLPGSRPDYIREIRNLSALVGPYIGETYSYLRTKYMNVGNPASIHFVPGPDHPSLKDPALPLARQHLKSWIDSWKSNMRTRFDPTVLEDMSKVYDISYEEISDTIGEKVRNTLLESPRERLQVTFKESVQARTFVI